MVAAVDSTSKLPIKKGVATFGLIEEAATQTTVKVNYRYTTNFDIIGRLIGATLDKQLTAGFQDFLAGLEVAAISNDV